MKISAVLRLLEGDGWTLARTLREDSSASTAARTFNRSSSAASKAMHASCPGTVPAVTTPLHYPTPAAAWQGVSHGCPQLQARTGDPH